LLYNLFTTGGPKKHQWENRSMSKQNTDNDAQSYFGMWIALGAGMGVALGAAFDNIALGLALGLAIGTAIGLGQSSSQRGGDEASEGDK